MKERSEQESKSDSLPIYKVIRDRLKAALADFGTTDVITLPPDAPLEEALEILENMLLVQF